MKKQTAWSLLAAAIAFAAVSYFAYQRGGQPRGAARDEILSLLSPEASAVLFADLRELRHAAFLGSLYAGAPRPEADPDYAQFLKETGFDYERDLDRIAIAVTKLGPDSVLFAIADGKFDRQKISAYALKTGTVTHTAGQEIYSVPLGGSQKKISFAFLRKDRVALTDHSNLGGFLSAKTRKEDAAEWRLRFDRLAGSPVFAVIRQDAAAGAALAAETPAGLRSPQLSALLDELQWITLAGRPEHDRLRIVAEGESAAETTARQLTDLLNGVVILAQAGLHDAKTRQQLDPATREAYLEVLKSADVSKIDRGDTKSVRVVFEITPKFLDAARTASPLAPGATPNKPLPGKASARKKGHT
ncbi:MAG TPA: hypothetical protein VH110_03730 [Candidatus Acidoferrum sp.]|nr:hypothetical protein [Candidatus Acidoferrum sp.]